MIIFFLAPTVVGCEPRLLATRLQGEYVRIPLEVRFLLMLRYSDHALTVLFVIAVSAILPQVVSVTEDHGAPEAEALSQAWTRGCK